MEVLKILVITLVFMLMVTLISVEAWKDYIPLTKRQLYEREKLCEPKGCDNPIADYFPVHNCINYCYEKEVNK